MSDMRFMTDDFSLKLLVHYFELCYYIDLSVIGFLSDCKAHNPNFFFSFKVVRCILLDGFDHGV